jgi:hypothetical protein
MTEEVINKVDNGKTAVLCYSTNTDSRTSQTFHSQCDDKGPTVTIVKLSTGKIIGGYASASWKSENSYTDTSESFLFSVSNRFIHQLDGNYNQGSLYNHAT